MQRLVCRLCLRWFRRMHVGVYVEERTRVAGESVPYRLWHADLHECPSCGYQIVAGFGTEPVAEHYEPEYAGLSEKLPLLGRVEEPEP